MRESECKFVDLVYFVVIPHGGKPMASFTAEYSA